MPPAAKKAKGAGGGASAAAAVPEDLVALAERTPFHPSEVAEQYTDYLARGVYTREALREKRKDDDDEGAGAGAGAGAGGGAGGKKKKAGEADAAKKPAKAQVPAAGRSYLINLDFSAPLKARWAAVKNEYALAAIKDVARALALDAHSGGGGVSGNDIGKMLVGRSVDKEFAGCVR